MWIDQERGFAIGDSRFVMAQSRFFESRIPNFESRFQTTPLVAGESSFAARRII